MRFARVPANVQVCAGTPSKRDITKFVPEDIGICGYDDIASAATAHPSLTTVAVEKEALGREAVTWLLDATGTTLKSVHPVRLVIRESSLGPQAR